MQGSNDHPGTSKNLEAHGFPRNEERKPPWNSHSFKNESVTSKDNTSLLERVLEIPSPISYAFISYLSLQDLVHILALSKSLRQSLVDPEKYGYIYKNLSITGKKDSVYRTPNDPYIIPIRELAFTVRRPPDELYNTSFPSIFQTILPSLQMIRYLCLDKAFVSPWTLEQVAPLENLVELSLRHIWADYVDILELEKRYACAGHPNPKLKRLRFWNSNGSALQLRLDSEVAAAQALSEYYETDVAQCESTGCPLKLHASVWDGVCTRLAERREWKCSGCGIIEKNICLGQLLPRTCEACEEYYCRSCMELPQRPMFTARGSTNARASGLKSLATARREKEMVQKPPETVLESGFTKTEFAKARCNGSYSVIKCREAAWVNRRWHYFHEDCYIQTSTMDTCSSCRDRNNGRLFMGTANMVILQPNMLQPRNRCYAVGCTSIFDGTENMTLEQCPMCQDWCCNQTCLRTCCFCEIGFSCTTCLLAGSITPIRVTREGVDYDICVLCFTSDPEMYSAMLETILLCGRPAPPSTFPDMNSEEEKRVAQRREQFDGLR